MYKATAWPAPSKGIRIAGKSLVVPSQAMSLREILTRFTRGEQLPIGREVSYHESEDDLERVSHMDLVDKAEYVELLKQKQKDYLKQEKAKAVKARKKLEDDALERAKKALESERAKGSQAPETE